MEKTEKRFFDNWIQTRIYSGINDDPQRVKEEYEKYLSEYPKDYFAQLFYCNALIMLGEIEEAKRLCDYVEMTANNDVNFVRAKRNKEYLTKDLVFCRVKILMSEENYKELYKFCIVNEPYLDNLNVSQVLCLCKKKMGCLKVEYRWDKPYLYRQIMEYDYDDFLVHIQKHRGDYVIDPDTSGLSIFKEDFPIKKVLQEVKKQIASNPGLFVGFVDDKYVFRYDGCGRVKNKVVSYFNVIVFHGTHDLITMYPIDEKPTNYIDINYIEDELKHDDTKIKRLSRVDRFNQKYMQKEA